MVIHSAYKHIIYTVQNVIHRGGINDYRSKK